MPIKLPAGLSGLEINAKSDWGEICVDVLDDEGGVLAKSVPVTGDGVRLDVAWAEGDIREFTERAVSLRFHLRNAHLYSWTPV